MASNWYNHLTKISWEPELPKEDPYILLFIPSQEVYVFKNPNNRAEDKILRSPTEAMEFIKSLGIERNEAYRIVKDSERRDLNYSCEF